MYTLITGASSGIGQAFAVEYAKKNKNLVLLARSKEKLKAIKAELEKKYQVKVEIVMYDLSVPNVAQHAYQRIQELGIMIETLINCAGFATSGKVSDVSYEQQHNEIMVNTVALFDLTKLFLDSMLKKNKGLIINVASTSAYHPIPTMAVYAASKAFVLSFTEALAMECQESQVRIFAISPGATDTNFFSSGGGVSYGNLRTPQHVVKVTLDAIEKGKISKIDGLNNYVTSTILPRILPRKNMVTMVDTIMKKQVKK